MDEKSMDDIFPLQQGKSFSSYRDINRAIEKHREMFGLRLALKRAIKLENYHLTVDQMKDLNLRLKYGELDYHCFAATGRPGRPGNGERCPQIVCLKLSADAQSLVVYKSHTHGIFPPPESVSKPALPAKQKDIITLPSDHVTCLSGDITLTPINHVSKDSAVSKDSPLVLTKLSQPQDPTTTLSTIPYQPGNFILDNNNAFTSIIPLSQTSSFPPSSPESEVNSISITPTPPFSLLAQNNLDGNSLGSDKNEKLTMKIKKSTVDPNEMVVVRGVHEKAEQQKIQRNSSPANLKNSDCLKITTAETTATTLKEITSTSRGSSALKSLSSVISPKPGAIAPKMVNNSSNKISNTQSGHSLVRRVTPEATGGGKPSTVSKTNSGTLQKVSPVPTSSSTKSPFGVTQKPLNVTPKQGTSPKTTTPPTPTKPTVLKLSSNMKQIIIKKPSHIAAGKPTMAKTTPLVKPLGDKNSNLPDQVKKLPQKSVTNAKVSKPGSTNNGIPTQGASEGTIKNGDKIRLKNAEKQVTKNGHTHMGVKSQAPGDKQVSKSTDNSGVMKQTLYNSAPSGNSMSAPVSGRLPSNPKRLLKKKPGRPPDSSNYIPISLDTELGSGEKQNLANGVLSQLLRVTSQLPMVEFSHALDTLEILTDAFRLGQRVTLSIRHKQEEVFHDESYTENLVESRIKSEAKELASPARTAPFPNLHRALVTSQLDGQLDSEQFLKGLRSFSSLLTVTQPPAEVMDIESPKIEAFSHGDSSEIEVRVWDLASSLKVTSSSSQNSKRGTKRNATGNLCVGLAGIKRAKL